MLHCSLAHSGAWGGVARRLEPHLAMTMPDLPGHGQSSPWAGGAEIGAAIAGSMAAFCAGPTDLVGHSIGAVALLRLALERPELCRSLILIEPVLFAACAGPAHAEYLRLITPIKQDLARGKPAAAAEGFNAIFGALPWGCLTDAQRQEQIDRIEFVNAFAGMVEDDSGRLLAPGRLEALDRPVLLLEATDSPPVIGAVHDALAARLPNATRVRIEGSRHMLPISHPSQVASAISDFLSL